MVKMAKKRFVCGNKRVLKKKFQPHDQNLGGGRLAEIFFQAGKKVPPNKLIFGEGKKFPPKKLIFWSGGGEKISSKKFP